MRIGWPRDRSRPKFLQLRSEILPFMPGKVNSVIPEVVSSIAYQLAGIDTAVTMAAELSSLELNPVECIIVYNELQGVSFLDKACKVLAQRCVAGIRANKDRDAAMVKSSIGLVTALNPVLGYERSAAIAKEALQTGRPVYDRGAGNTVRAENHSGGREIALPWAKLLYKDYRQRSDHHRRRQGRCKARLSWSEVGVAPQE